jgi:hypothetical protein
MGIDMHRKYCLTHDGRNLEIRVRSTEEAWELWLFENGHRLALVDVLTIEEAIAARRNGTTDPMAEVVRSIAHRLAAGDILAKVGNSRPAGMRRDALRAGALTP